MKIEKASTGLLYQEQGIASCSTPVILACIDVVKIRVSSRAVEYIWKEVPLKGAVAVVVKREHDIFGLRAVNPHTFGWPP